MRGEILSSVELVLPPAVVETCYNIKRDVQARFRAVNSEEKTKSEITVEKQTDDSVRIHVVIVSLVCLTEDELYEEVSYNVPDKKNTRKPVTKGKRGPKRKVKPGLAKKLKKSPVKKKPLKVHPHKELLQSTLSETLPDLGTDAVVEDADAGVKDTDAEVKSPERVIADDLKETKATETGELKQEVPKTTVSVEEGGEWQNKTAKRGRGGRGRGGRGRSLRGRRGRGRGAARCINNIEHLPQVESAAQSACQELQDSAEVDGKLTKEKVIVSSDDKILPVTSEEGDGESVPVFGRGKRVRKNTDRSNQGEPEPESTPVKPIRLKRKALQPEKEDVDAAEGLSPTTGKTKGRKPKCSQESSTVPVSVSKLSKISRKTKGVSESADPEVSAVSSRELCITDKSELEDAGNESNSESVLLNINTSNQGVYKDNAKGRKPKCSPEGSTAPVSKLGKVPRKTKTVSESASAGPAVVASSKAEFNNTDKSDLDVENNSNSVSASLDTSTSNQAVYKDSPKGRKPKCSAEGSTAAVSKLGKVSRKTKTVSESAGTAVIAYSKAEFSNTGKSDLDVENNSNSVSASLDTNTSNQAVYKDRPKGRKPKCSPEGSTASVSKLGNLPRKTKTVSESAEPEITAFSNVGRDNTDKSDLDVENNSNSVSVSLNTNTSNQGAYKGNPKGRKPKCSPEGSTAPVSVPKLSKVPRKTKAAIELEGTEVAAFSKAELGNTDRSDLDVGNNSNSVSVSLNTKASNQGVYKGNPKGRKPKCSPEGSAAPVSVSKLSKVPRKKKAISESADPEVAAFSDVELGVTDKSDLEDAGNNSNSVSVSLNTNTSNQIADKDNTIVNQKPKAGKGRPKGKRTSSTKVVTDDKQPNNTQHDDVSVQSKTAEIVSTENLGQSSQNVKTIVRLGKRRGRPPAKRVNTSVPELSAPEQPVPDQLTTDYLVRDHESSTQKVSDQECTTNIDPDYHVNLNPVTLNQTASTYVNSSQTTSDHIIAFPGQQHDPSQSESTLVDSAIPVPPRRVKTKAQLKQKPSELAIYSDNDADTPIPKKLKDGDSTDTEQHNYISKQASKKPIQKPKTLARIWRTRKKSGFTHRKKSKPRPGKENYTGQSDKDSHTDVDTADKTIAGSVKPDIQELLTNVQIDQPKDDAEVDRSHIPKKQTTIDENEKREELEIIPDSVQAQIEQTRKLPQKKRHTAKLAAERKRAAVEQANATSEPVVVELGSNVECGTGRHTEIITGAHTDSWTDPVANSGPGPPTDSGPGPPTDSGPGQHANSEAAAKNTSGNGQKNFSGTGPKANSVTSPPTNEGTSPKANSGICPPANSGTGLMTNCGTVSSTTSGAGLHTESAILDVSLDLYNTCTNFNETSAIESLIQLSTATDAPLSGLHQGSLQYTPEQLAPVNGFPGASPPSLLHIAHTEDIHSISQNETDTATNSIIDGVSQAEVIQQLMKIATGPKAEGSEVSDESVRQVKRAYKREFKVQCRFCQVKVKDYGYLFRHVKKLHRDKGLEMKQHLEEIRPLMRTPCPICHKMVSSISNISSHIKQCHATKESAVLCPICKKTYKTTVSLRQHLRQCHQPQQHRFFCHLCSANFTEKRSLKEHINCSHETTQVFQCDDCGKSFLTKGRLRRHKYIHGDFRHRCNYCNKGFHLKDNMNKHIEIVHEKTQGKRFKCPHCDKKFTVKGNMTQHVMGVHLKQFQYTCPQCQTGFRRKKDMLSHMLKHGDVPSGTVMLGEFDGDEEDDDRTEDEDDSTDTEGQPARDSPWTGRGERTEIITGPTNRTTGGPGAHPRVIIISPVLGYSEGVL